VLVVHLGGTLEKTRVEVENVTGVSLTSWRTTEKEGHLTVRNGLLGEIVEDDDSVLAVVTEPLTHRASGERSDILKRGGFGGGGSNDDGVLHSIVLLKSLDELGNGGSLLSDGNVYTVELLGLVVSVVPSLLVQHGVKGNSGLSGLTITNDQLTLSTSNGHHCVDRFETSLYGLVDGSARQNARRLQLGTALLGGLDGSLAINWVSESVNNTAEHLNSDRNIDLGFP
jgi:hypothetical protein